MSAREQPVDMRSDAVTRPTEAMWAAMGRAEAGWAPAGDDIYGVREGRVEAVREAAARGR